MAVILMESTAMEISNRKNTRKSLRGNALMEYVLPIGLILLTCGVLAASIDITGILGNYFMAASGHQSDALSDGVFETSIMASKAKGFTGNGIGGFTSFGTMLDASGQPTGEKSSGVFFVGSINRPGARAASPSSEYLYP